MSAAYPHFAGFYVGRPGLHVNVTELRDIDGLVALLVQSFGSSVEELVRTGVHAHVVTYSYRELYDMMYGERARPLRANRYLYAMALLERKNRLLYQFLEGISPAEIEALIEASGLPLDAVEYRSGGSVSDKLLTGPGAPPAARE